MHPHGREDETDFEDDVLVKRMKKIKQAAKPCSKKLQMRSKKCARAKAEKERKSVQKSPGPTKQGQLFVVQHDNQKKPPKQQVNTNTTVQDSKLVQKPAEPNTKHKKILQTRMSPVGFVAMIDKFNRDIVTLSIAAEKKIGVTPMYVHLTMALPISGRKVKAFYGKKPKDPKYNEFLLAWRK
ncbi:hypothetical protein Cgig2_000628 [Carnegiea gigantea]|uniref:Uncharacterized protein n=1 Tax=Carnegiea gigantea TaxID=171969 RepID=A0A9Q1QI73_9CARY|nr:hypothetical protein Cgig2_000628 [Carnegiea gigantea]